MPSNEFDLDEQTKQKAAAQQEFDLEQPSDEFNLPPRPKNFVDYATNVGSIGIGALEAPFEAISGSLGFLGNMGKTLLSPIQSWGPESSRIAEENRLMKESISKSNVLDTLTHGAAQIPYLGQLAGGTVGMAKPMAEDISSGEPQQMSKGLTNLALTVLPTLKGMGAGKFKLPIPPEIQALNIEMGLGYKGVKHFLPPAYLERWKKNITTAMSQGGNLVSDEINPLTREVWQQEMLRRVAPYRKAQHQMSKEPVRGVGDELKHAEDMTKNFHNAENQYVNSIYGNDAILPDLVKQRIQNDIIAKAPRGVTPEFMGEVSDTLDHWLNNTGESFRDVLDKRGLFNDTITDTLAKKNLQSKASARKTNGDVYALDALADEYRKLLGDHVDTRTGTINPQTGVGEYGEMMRNEKALMDYRDKMRELYKNSEVNKLIYPNKQSFRSRMLIKAGQVANTMPMFRKSAAEGFLGREMLQGMGAEAANPDRLVREAYHNMTGKGITAKTTGFFQARPGKPMQFREALPSKPINLNPPPGAGGVGPIAGGGVPITTTAPALPPQIQQGLMQTAINSLQRSGRPITSQSVQYEMTIMARQLTEGGEGVIPSPPMLGSPEAPTFSTDTRSSIAVEESMNRQRLGDVVNKSSIQNPIIQNPTFGKVGINQSTIYHNPNTNQLSMVLNPDSIDMLSYASGLDAVGATLTSQNIDHYIAKVKDTAKRPVYTPENSPHSFATNPNQIAQLNKSHSDSYNWLAKELEKAKAAMAEKGEPTLNLQGSIRPNVSAHEKTHQAIYDIGNKHFQLLNDNVEIRDFVEMGSAPPEFQGLSTQQLNNLETQLIYHSPANSSIPKIRTEIRRRAEMQEKINNYMEHSGYGDTYRNNPPEFMEVELPAFLTGGDAVNLFGISPEESGRLLHSLYQHAENVSQHAIFNPRAQRAGKFFMENNSPTAFDEMRLIYSNPAESLNPLEGTYLNQGIQPTAGRAKPQIIKRPPTPPSPFTQMKGVSK